MKYKILNKKGSTRVLLIHGLYATSGYWLNYLKWFKNSQILIVDIDYQIPFDFKSYVIELESLVDKVFDGKLDFVFSHSLGTIIANLIPENKFNHSFEICPVHSSSRKNNSNFVDTLLQKSIKNNDLESIIFKLSYIDQKLIDIKKNLKFSGKRTVLFPDSDDYFSYENIVKFNLIIFSGDHFDIENALKKSFDIIM